MAQPACENSARPFATSPAFSGAFGVRTATRTHSRRAVSAGTALPLPAGVTVICGRSAFGLASALTTQGGTLPRPLSATSRPWLGSNVLCAGGGNWQSTGWASAPGPETLRMFASKSSTSSKIAE